MQVIPNQYASNLGKSLAAEKLSQVDSSVGSIEKNNDAVQQENKAIAAPLDTVTISKEARTKLQERVETAAKAKAEEEALKKAKEDDKSIESNLKSEGLREPQNADDVAIEQLKEMLEDAQERLQEARDKLLQAQQKLAGAETETERMAAQAEVDMQGQYVALGQSEVILILKRLQEAQEAKANSIPSANDPRLDKE